MNKRGSNPKANRRNRGESGFSMVELSVVSVIILAVTAMAIVQMGPGLQSARSDDALRIVLSQMRQAREYSIDNRRYVQIAFPIVSGQPQIVLTQMNTLTPGGGTTNTVLSTVYLPVQIQYTLIATMPDTPDGFGNGAATAFKIEGTSTTPAGLMYFQSDGELIDSLTSSPIDGTIFVGVPGNASSARAVTVMGSTGRVRGWKAIGVGGSPTADWLQF